MTQNNFPRELSWDDELTIDGGRIDLPDGLYYFTVKNVERGRHTPQAGGKLPACNKATVTVEVATDHGSVELRHNLFLHSSTEGMLSAFFAAIGQKKKGEPLRMNWNNVLGATGVCKVGHREYNGNNYNDLKSMLYPEDVDYTKVLNSQPGAAPQAAYQPQQPATGGFSGQF
jgi:hypothetical protein